MSQVDLPEGEPEPRLVGTPVDVVVRITFGREVLGEIKSERPNEAEARAFCRELVPKIEALVRGGATYIQ